MNERSITRMSINPSIVSDILKHCERTRSKEARVALERLFYKPLEKLDIKLSTNCPLSNEKDVLLTQELAKLPLENSVWMCNLCSKMFQSEHYLDKHLARKHATIIENPATSVCPADLCGSIVPCVPLTKEPLPLVSTELLAKMEREELDHFELNRPEFCDEEIMKKRRTNACLHVLEKCVQKPLRYRLSSRLFKNLLSQLENDLCHRAVMTECIPRQDIFRRLGSHEQVLRSSVRINPFLSKKFISISSFVLGIIFVLGLLLFRKSFRRIKSEKIT